MEQAGLEQLVLGNPCEGSDSEPSSDVLFPSTPSAFSKPFFPIPDLHLLRLLASDNTTQN